jgi:Zyg-11 protein homolog
MSIFTFFHYSHLQNLSYLDLSGCLFAEFSLEALVDVRNLQTLILFNVWPLEHEFPTLCKLKNLRTLDLSVVRTNTNGTYTDPNQVLVVPIHIFKDFNNQLFPHFLCSCLAI